MALLNKEDIKKVNFERIPESLKQFKGFVLWKAIYNTKSKIYTKIPFQVNGENAKSNDSETWSDFQTVKSVYELGGYDGIGFMFHEDFGIIGIDIDGIEMDDVNEDIRTKNLLKRTYCETSVSGKGVHALLIGCVPSEYHPSFNNRENGIEAYAALRFFTMTGAAINDMDIENDKELIEALFKKYGHRVKDNEVNTDFSIEDIEIDESLSEEDVMKRIKGIKNELRRKKVLDLFEDGENSYSKYGFQSQSEADASLVETFLFYSDLNYQVVHSLMEQSSLGQRDKWYSPRRSYLNGDAYSTYGWNTIFTMLYKMLQQDNGTFSTYTIKNAQKEFDEIIDEKAPQDNKDWLEKLERNSKTGEILPNRRNLRLILTNDKHLKDSFRMNAFSRQREIHNMPHWRVSGDDGILFTDSDESAIRNYIEEIYDISADRKVTDLLNELFSRKSYHPIKDYIESVEWDGHERINSLFIDYLGSDNNSYVRRITELSLVGAVSRIYEPGVKFDTMTILYGQQGTHKSTILAKLGGAWFNDSILDIGHKDAYQALEGSWIFEMSELASMNKKQSNEIKQFLSSRKDKYRPAYGKYVIEVPRQSVFFGTTNQIDFLKDETGGRRFYPISVNPKKRTKNVFKDLTEKEVQQIWAEAYSKYKDGVKIALDSEKEEDIIHQAESLQKQHTENDGLADQIIEFLNHPIEDYELSDLDTEKEQLYRDRICWQIVWYEMLGQKIQPSKIQIRQINSALRSIDFLIEKNVVRFSKYGSTRGFLVSFEDII